MVLLARGHNRQVLRSVVSSVLAKRFPQDHHNWQWAELLGKGKKEPATCFAYKSDCLVVAFPRSNVQVWQLIEGLSLSQASESTARFVTGTWQLLSLKPSISQRDVTCMKFIDGGDALLGGTSNGKL